MNAKAPRRSIRHSVSQLFMENAVLANLLCFDKYSKLPLGAIRF
jgi:hypothetical protein